MCANRALQALHGVIDCHTWSKLQFAKKEQKIKEGQKADGFCLNISDLQETHISTRIVDIQIEHFGLNTIKVQHSC